MRASSCAPTGPARAGAAASSRRNRLQSSSSGSGGRQEGLRYTSRAEMAGERVKLKVRRGSRAEARPRGACVRTGSSPVSSTATAARRIRSRSRSASSARSLTGEHGLHAILDVVLEGSRRLITRSSRSTSSTRRGARLLHIDLQEVRLDQAIHAGRRRARRRVRGVVRRAACSPDQSRGQRRGAPDGGAGPPRARRLARWSSATACASPISASPKA